MAIDLSLGLGKDACTLVVGLGLSFLDNSVARRGSLPQDGGLLVASLLQHGFTLFLDVLELIIGLLGLAKAFVNVSLTLVDHLHDSRKSKLPKNQEDDDEDQRHPKKQSTFRD